jgi:hypothetical protein
MLHVCDDWIVVPLGMFALSGTCAACLSLHGAVADKKLLVHPESIISVSSVVALEGVGVQSKDTPPHHSLPHCTPPMLSIFVAAY